MTAGLIHIGVGGWDYDPWREAFYPAGLSKAKQLGYAAQHLTATEVNATFYRLQKPATFANWAKMVPDDFRFAIKASRYCTNRKNLAEAAEGIGNFFAQGLTELGEKLGPILWQLAPTKKFDPEELRAFLALLPGSRDGVALRHALEVRHDSFRCREFIAIARASNVAVVFADSDDYPEIADLTADFAYARLQRTREGQPTGYPARELDRWAAVLRGWSRGDNPEGLDYAGDASGPAAPREVFAFIISGHKVVNPAAALALIARIQD